MDGRLTDKVIDYFRVYFFGATRQDRCQGVEEPRGDVEPRVRAPNVLAWLSSTRIVDMFKSNLDPSNDDLERRAAADCREVDPPIPVETATGSKAGELDCG
jgi:hypothetical protein